jgi:hypothetical protein
MMARLAATTAVVLALLLGACGGDDSGDGKGQGGSGATSGAAAGATGGVDTTEPGDDKSSDPEVPRIDPPEANQEPVPEGSVPPEDRTGKPPRYTRENPLSKEQLKAIERPIYEQTRYLCKRLGVEGLKREYRLDSSDPEKVARAVAERTYQREARDAVFSGCLSGLRSGD